MKHPPISVRGFDRIHFKLLQMWSCFVCMVQVVVLQVNSCVHSQAPCFISWSQELKLPPPHQTKTGLPSPTRYRKKKTPFLFSLFLFLLSQRYSRHGKAKQNEGWGAFGHTLDLAKVSAYMTANLQVLQCYASSNARFVFSFAFPFGLILPSHVWRTLVFLPNPSHREPHHTWFVYIPYFGSRSSQCVSPIRHGF